MSDEEKQRILEKLLGWSKPELVAEIERLLMELHEMTISRDRWKDMAHGYEGVKRPAWDQK